MFQVVRRRSGEPSLHRKLLVTKAFRAGSKHKPAAFKTLDVFVIRIAVFVIRIAVFVIRIAVFVIVLLFFLSLLL